MLSLGGLKIGFKMACFKIDRRTLDLQVKIRDCWVPTHHRVHWLPPQLQDIWSKCGQSNKAPKHVSKTEDIKHVVFECGAAASAAKTILMSRLIQSDWEIV